MKVIVRPALDSDLPVVRGLFGPWTEENPSVTKFLEQAVLPQPQTSWCRVAEADGKVESACLWTEARSGHISILALAIEPDLGNTEAADEFVRQHIMEWAARGIARASIQVPAKVREPVGQSLRNCGFMFEGLTTCCEAAENYGMRFCKHFLYREIHHSEVLDFLRQVLVGIGYEIRNEQEGFSYRIRNEVRFPFSFPFWHRISKMGHDIVVHPPARVLEWHELETQFYPMQIYARHERPFVLHLPKRSAATNIDLPEGENRQDSLFWTASSVARPRPLHATNLTFSDSAGVHGMRKGLPILFYVNRVGAVGHARTLDWYMEDASNLQGDTVPLDALDSREMTEQTASAGSKSGKVLAVRFHWYTPMRRAVGLDEIRRMDHSFNPQRTRHISRGLFQSILASGNTAEPSVHP
jgi:hypothetical protein